MKYRHRFHAGNFADVLKHLVLTALLRALTRRDAPFFFLDTHAGRGRYESPHTHPEYAAGFARLRGQTLPPLLADYVTTVEQMNGAQDPATSLQFHPGSPLLAAHLMRPQDRALVCELQFGEAGRLREALRSFRNFSIQTGDGYAAVKSQLPPRERRGLVLIDPAYEQQEQEFPAVLACLREAHRRWPTGLYAIWYPIKRRAPIRHFHDRLRASGIKKILCAELLMYPDDSRVSLNGCGMIIINPPWQLDVSLQTELPALHDLLQAPASTASATRCHWLAPE